MKEQLRAIENYVVNILRCLQNLPEDKLEMLDIIKMNLEGLEVEVDLLSQELKPEDWIEIQ